MVFNTGRFMKHPGGEFRDLNELSLSDRRKLLDTSPTGLFTLYGYYFNLQDEFVRPAVLQSWRDVGDDVADAAAFSVQRARTPSTSEDAASELVTLSLSDGPCAKLVSDLSSFPAWVDWARVAKGQATLRRNLPAIGIMLLELSLLGGFGAGLINKVLLSTGYLNADRDVSYRRLLETLQMVLDCSEEGALRPGGRGWRSIASVRLLHAGVRTRLMGSGRWDAEANGIPINQEDMLVTQLAFSIVVLMGMENAGLAWHLTDGCMEDFLHLWRVIGHVMGVRLQPKEGAMCETLAGATTLLESVVAHIVEPDATSRVLALSTVRAVAYRLPLPWSPRTHVAVCRRVAGEDYADALGIPVLDDPALAEEIVDDRPTTALTPELRFVRSANPDLAADHEASLRVVSVTALSLAVTGISWALRLTMLPVMLLVRGLLAAGGRARSFFLGVARPPRSPAAQAHEIGEGALRPLYVLPYLLSIPVLRDVLAWAQLQRMSALIHVRLGGRPDFRLRHAHHATHVQRPTAAPSPRKPRKGSRSG